MPRRVQPLISKEWEAKADSAAAVAHAVPHRVLPQLLHTMLSAALPSTRVKVKSVSDVQRCTTTLRMKLRGVTIPPSALAFAAACPSLTTMDLSDTTADTVFFRHISEVPHLIKSLRFLNLSFCLFDDDGLAFVAMLRNLETLILRFCSDVETTGLLAISRYASWI